LVRIANYIIEKALTKCLRDQALSAMSAWEAIPQKRANPKLQAPNPKQIQMTKFKIQNRFEHLRFEF
jgi:hypothetical protein